jgi:hypothetical protein
MYADFLRHEKATQLPRKLGALPATVRTPRDAGLCRAQPIMVPCGRWATNLTHARNSSAIEGGSAAPATTPWRLFMIQR